MYLKGILKYNSEKGYYELFVKSGKVKEQPITLFSISTGSSHVWEGNLLEEFKNRFNQQPICYYDNTSQIL